MSLPVIDLESKDKSLSSTLGGALKRLGYEVLQTAPKNGEQSAALFIVDLLAPESGLATIQRIRKHFHQTPIIALVDFGDKESAKLSMLTINAGASAVIPRTPESNLTSLLQIQLAGREPAVQ